MKSSRRSPDPFPFVGAIALCSVSQVSDVAEGASLKESSVHPTGLIGVHILRSLSRSDRQSRASPSAFQRPKNEGIDRHRATSGRFSDLVGFGEGTAHKNRASGTRSR